MTQPPPTRPHRRPRCCGSPSAVGTRPRTSQTRSPHRSGSHNAASDSSARPDLAGSSTGALATLPEVLTAREAAAILRVGRNQLYQAVARGQLGAVHIGRSIRIPKQALLALLASGSAGGAGGDE